MSRDLQTISLPGRRAFLTGTATALAASVAPSTAAQPAPSPSNSVTPQAFGAAADGRSDDIDAIERALAAARSSGKTLFLPSGVYRLSRPLVLLSPEALTYAPRFAVGPRILGAGAGVTQLLATFGGAPVLDIVPPSIQTDGFSATLGAHVEGLTIRSSAGASGIRLHSAYQAVLRDLHLISLNNGIEIACFAGDRDGSNMVRIEDVRIEICEGWGIDAAAADGFNEISFIRCEQVVVQGCGRADGSGGGMRWKGQNCVLEQCAFTLNHNVGLFIPGAAGSAQTLDIDSVTFENNGGRHLFCTGISALKGRNLQFYSGGNPKVDVGCELDGRHNTIRYIELDGIVVRAAAANSPHTAFRVGGTHAELDHCRVRNVIWEDFDHPRQTRFEGFLFDHAVQCCRIRVLSPTEIALAPDAGRGNRTPLRLGGATSASGEWIEAAVTSAVILRADGLRQNQTYQIYLYDDRNVKRLEASQASPVPDPASGYLVKPGDASRLHVGQIRTDMAGRFVER